MERPEPQDGFSRDEWEAYEWQRQQAIELAWQEHIDSMYCDVGGEG